MNLINKNTNRGSIIIVNWRGVRNDPYSFFTHCLKETFVNLGRSTMIVNHDEIEKFLTEMLAIGTENVDFVVSIQGAGTKFISWWE